VQRDDFSKIVGLWGLVLKVRSGACQLTRAKKENSQKTIFGHQHATKDYFKRHINVKNNILIRLIAEELSQQRIKIKMHKQQPEAHGKTVCRNSPQRGLGTNIFSLLNYSTRSAPFRCSFWIFSVATKHPKTQTMTSELLNV
jgi:hypothetical protein